MALTLCAWHVPAAFDLALRSPPWHKLEHACFFGAALFFWLPVVRPFPNRPHWPLWSVPLYLLVADLLNTALSAILTFSDHVLYSTYLEVPRLFGTTALADQGCAGVIMWVPGSLPFLIPAALIAIESLSPRALLVRPQAMHRSHDLGLSPHPLIGGIFRADRSQAQPLIKTAALARWMETLGLVKLFQQFFEGGKPLKRLTLLSTSSHRAKAAVIMKSLRDVDEISGSNPLVVEASSPIALNRSGADVPRRFDLLSVPLIGPFLRAQSGRRFLQTTLLIMAIAVILDGLFGPQVGSANLAGVLPWTYWRVFVVIALLAAGNFFCMACPFMLVRDMGRRLGFRQRPWPRALRSKWLAIGLLVLFFWAYEVFNLWDRPIWTAWLIINYFLVAFAIDALFSKASFCKYICPIGQFQFITSLVSPLEVKVREPAVCGSCKTHDCLRGNAQHRGCEMDLYLPRKSGNLDCTFCLDCVRACPSDNVGIMGSIPGLEVVRDPQRTSLGRFSRRPDIAALGLVFVFAAFANAAMMVGPISSWRDHLATRLNQASALPITSILFFFALVVAPLFLVFGSVFAGRAIAGITTPVRELIKRFSLALVPLAAGMWAAHFLFHFLMGWQSAWPVFQRVLGELGLSVANQNVSGGIGLTVGMDNVRMLQTLLLDIGLLATLYVGWRVARVYAPRLRSAFHVMAPWGIVAVSLYSFGIWTCLQPMQMRGLPNLVSYNSSHKPLFRRDEFHESHKSLRSHGIWASRSSPSDL
jgi:ferredoxin